MLTISTTLVLLITDNVIIYILGEVQHSVPIGILRPALRIVAPRPRGCNTRFPIFSKPKPLYSYSKQLVQQKNIQQTLCRLTLRIGMLHLYHWCNKANSLFSANDPVPIYFVAPLEKNSGDQKMPLSISNKSPCFTSNSKNFSPPIDATRLSA